MSAPGRPAHEVGGARLPIVVSLGGIGVDAAWWLRAARRLDEAGYAGVATWDHHASRGTPRPVLEAWTMLSAAAVEAPRLALWTHVLNVMNRHPVVLARMASTLQQVSGGRLVLGIGIGGSAADHEPFGIPNPDAAGRAGRVEELVVVLRLLWSGEPVTFEGRFTTLRGARLLPAPAPPPPIVIAGQTPAGARLAARVGDGWTTRATDLARLLPVYEGALMAAGRERASVSVIAGWEGGRTGVDALAGSPWIAGPREAWEEWRAAGADGINVVARTTADVDALVEAAARW